MFSLLSFLDAICNQVGAIAIVYLCVYFYILVLEPGTCHQPGKARRLHGAARSKLFPALAALAMPIRHPFFLSLFLRPLIFGLFSFDLFE